MPGSISRFMAYCGLATALVSASCDHKPRLPAAATPASTFVFSHDGSLWVRPNGLPDPDRAVLVAGGPLGLSVRHAVLRLDVTVDGRPLPPGESRWNGRSSFMTLGRGPGYRYRSTVSFRSNQVVASCAVWPETEGTRLEVSASRDIGVGPEPVGRWAPARRTQLPGLMEWSAVAVTRRVAGGGESRPPRGQEAPVPPLRLIELEQGPAEDQATIARLAHQLGAEEYTGVAPLAPFGATSKKYAGRVFWDADVWMLPALALTHPEQARAVPRFRLMTRAAAEEEFRAWCRAGRPVGQAPGGRTRAMGTARAPGRGLKVPWETGEDGTERCLSDGRWAHHATAGAAWGMLYAAKLGLADARTAEEYVRLASEFYRLRAAEGPGGTFTVADTLSPDENVYATHDAYTNLAADLICRASGAPLGTPYLPVLPDGAPANYSEDKGGRLNQHALLLAVWPLEHPLAVARAKEVFEACQGRTNPQGPAMSLSIEAVVQARLGDPDAALQTWRDSVARYEHGPQLLFGETMGAHEGVFRTGVAGCWSALVYGFLGVHVGDAPVAGAQWQTRLRSGAWASLRPSLPQAWTRLRAHLVFDGVWRSFVVTHDGLSTSEPLRVL